MSIQDDVVESDQGDLDASAHELVAGLTREPWGHTSPSPYETGRLVSIAPWLAGHTERLAYLVDAQRVDGGWGPPDGYALVPTLSATEALLGVDADRRPTIAMDLPGAADRGLRSLQHLLRHPGSLSIPDTPAVDLIVPALVERINQHLEAARDERRLQLPSGMDATRLVALRRRFAAGLPIPDKLPHALEVLGDVVQGDLRVRPVPPGVVGASPAATAAWLGGRDRSGPAYAYLEAVVRRYAGPVPCATPITVFERAWVLSGLARAGLWFTAPAGLIRSLVEATGPAGAAAGPGLPADADTTSVAVYTLAGLGAASDPDVLWRYDTGTHFCTWPGEDGFSVSTNAHVLDAFGRYVSTSAEPVPRHRQAVLRLSAWLCEQQRPDGEWRDRWHASPYYATACCALALAEYGRGPAADVAVRGAVDWVLATQRPDGSWGRWTGSAEETAYAMQVLLMAGDATGDPALDGRTEAAAVRGERFLLSTAGRRPDPPLWHDKDLYLPSAIVRTAVLAALHLVRSRPGPVHRAGASGSRPQP